jgi:probable rRNA maturation factor
MPQFEIQILNRQRRYKIDRESVVSFCTVLLRSLKLREKTLSIVFLTAGDMRSMNSRYRGRDYATDVLSFSYGNQEMEGRDFLGEIFIAPEVAIKQSVQYGISPEREVRKLLVHGTLHLIGCDHESDKGQMNHRQRNIMRRKFFMNARPLLRLETIQ